MRGAEQQQASKPASQETRRPAGGGLIPTATHHRGPGRARAVAHLARGEAGAQLGVVGDNPQVVLAAERDSSSWLSMRGRWPCTRPANSPHNMLNCMSNRSSLSPVISPLLAAALGGEVHALRLLVPLLLCIILCLPLLAAAPAAPALPAALQPRQGSGQVSEHQRRSCAGGHRLMHPAQTQQHSLALGWFFQMKSSQLGAYSTRDRRSRASRSPHWPPPPPPPRPPPPPGPRPPPACLPPPPPCGGGPAWASAAWKDCAVWAMLQGWEQEGAGGGVSAGPSQTACSRCRRCTHTPASPPPHTPAAKLTAG